MNTCQATYTSDGRQ